jgi:hypothetical protein
VIGHALAVCLHVTLRTVAWIFVKYDVGSLVDAYPFGLPLNKMKHVCWEIFFFWGGRSKLPVLEIM